MECAQLQSTTPNSAAWGERDPALSIHLLDGLEQVAANVEVKRLPDAGRCGAVLDIVLRAR
jgi:hypothetical protein